MTQKNDSIVIIGSGLAGYMLAKEFRKLDTVTPLHIFTADDGAFYSKPLLSTALTQGKTAEQLEVSNAKTMANELHATIDIHTEVLAIDPDHQEIVLVDRRVPYTKLVLACGGQVISPPLSGDATQAILSVNSLTDYREFRKMLVNKRRIAILGAGLVGCEFANDLINMGYSVDIIAPENHPLANLVPTPIGNLLHKSLAEKGVTWHLGHLATAVSSAGNAYAVGLSNGEELVVDGVVSAVGIRPRTALAKGADITINRGIMVNRWLQTSIASIYALGDCAEVDGTIKQYVAPLLQCARTLAKILVGGTEPLHYPVMPVVIKTPACPIVTEPPPIDVVGEWHIEGTDQHLQALFHDQTGQLRGFSLVGERIRDKMPLAKQLPLVFTD